MYTGNCTCNPAPDADLLGLGVRLGAYLQATAAVVGLHLSPEDAPQEAWMQVFTVAPILALALKYTLQRAVSNALFLSTTYLAFPQMITLGPGLWLPKPFKHVLLAWLTLGVLLYTFGLIFWFWVYGYQRCCDGSTVYAFIGARVEAFSGWFRIFAIAPSALMLLSLPALITAMFALKQALELPDAGPAQPSFSGYQGAQRVQPGSGSCQGSVWRRFVYSWARRDNPNPYSHADGSGRVSTALFVLPLLAFSVAGTELTLHWNGITDVYALAGTGQLVPLLVGAGALLKALYFALGERCGAAVRPSRSDPSGTSSFSQPSPMV
ncbi:hypothetical protein ABPG75_009023 [Micractinium tetrahymenae]